MKRLALLAFLLVLPAAAQAAPNGQGAIVIRDDSPIYAHSKGDKVEWKLKRGDAVAGFMMQYITTENRSGEVLGMLTYSEPAYQFEEVDGRVHVLYLKAATQKGSFTDHTAWMDPKDLSRFTYAGGCDANGSPTVVKGFGSKQWNACFAEAMDNKLDTLRVLWTQADAAKAPATPTPAPTAAPAEKAKH